MSQFKLLFLVLFILIPSAFAQDDVSIDIGDIPQGQQVTVSYSVSVGPLPPGIVFISNQGVVTGSNFSPVLSYDPATGVGATLSQTGFNLPVSQLPSTGETPLSYIVLLSLLIASIGAISAYSFAKWHRS